MKATTLLLAASLASLSPLLPAQTVYRCGPDGRTYTDQPCPAGRAVDAADPRSEAQQREALAVARTERALAREMAAERRAREREAVARASGPAGITRPPPVEFTPPARGAAADRPSDKRKERQKAGAHVTWKARSPKP